jgi:hypothetical protein
MNMQDRVIAAAKAVLQREGAVGPLELLQRIGFLHFTHVEQWRKGNEYYSDLESHIQCGEKKLAETWRHFLEWVGEKKLEPVEASYVGATRFGAEPLQITIDGDPQREEFFRTQYRPADLSRAKKQRLENKLNKTPDLTVFQLTSDRAECSECGVELLKGELLFLEKQLPLCLTCADMDHLEFLPSGDTALTRRTRKHSPLVAIVVRFNRSRKRYERQGILATPDAIARAEDECASDADERAARRKLDAARRGEQDKKLVADMTAAILAEYPACPPAEAAAIAAHTATRGSGRIGRSAAGQALSPDSIPLAVRAWIRHQHTRYDQLLMQGIPRDEAREMIAGNVERVAESWAT